MLIQLTEVVADIALFFPALGLTDIVKLPYELVDAMLATAVIVENKSILKSIQAAGATQQTVNNLQAFNAYARSGIREDMENMLENGVSASLTAKYGMPKSISDEALERMGYDDRTQQPDQI